MIWQDIKNYAKEYQVSNSGLVRSKDRFVADALNGKRFIKGILLKPYLNKDGYPCVSLSQEGRKKTMQVHLLVWNAFGTQKRNGLIIQVDHIDGDKQNCSIQNLQLLTNRFNQIKKYRESGRVLPTGVTYHPETGKYRARIRNNSQKSISLGLYYTPKLASKAYEKALIKITGKQ